jgi:hypothetical protein
MLWMLTTIGWARRITPAVSLGVEAIGEDLEGFWEHAEAEVLPSTHLQPAGVPPEIRFEVRIVRGVFVRFGPRILFAAIADADDVKGGARLVPILARKDKSTAARHGSC